MDPIAALSFAANIIQFVDFATKLFLETRDIYKSATGSPPGVRTLSTISTELASLSNNISTTEVGSLGLRNLAIQSADVAEDLRVALASLTVRGDRKVWKSFVIALRHVRKDKEIDELRRRVGEMQVQLGLQMQEVIL